MLVEHSFISTLEPAEVLELSHDLLLAFGFEPRAVSADRAEFGRGKKKPAQFSVMEDLPQSCIVPFARARVDFSAVLQPFHKAKTEHREFLLTIATTLEAYVSSENETVRATIAMQKVQELQSIEQTFDDSVRRKKRNRRIGCWVLILALVLFVVALFVLGTIFVR